MGQWRGVIGAKTQLEEAALMIEALQITGGAQDIMIQIFAVTALAWDAFASGMGPFIIEGPPY